MCAAAPIRLYWCWWCVCTSSPPHCRTGGGVYTSWPLPSRTGGGSGVFARVVSGTQPNSWWCVCGQVGSYPSYPDQLLVVRVPKLCHTRPNCRWWCVCVLKLASPPLHRPYVGRVCAQVRPYPPVLVELSVHKLAPTSPYWWCCPCTSSSLPGRTGGVVRAQVGPYPAVLVVLSVHKLAPTRHAGGVVHAQVGPYLPYLWCCPCARWPLSGRTVGGECAEVGPYQAELVVMCVHKLASTHPKWW